MNDLILCWGLLAVLHHRSSLLLLLLFHSILCTPLLLVSLLHVTLIIYNAHIHYVCRPTTLPTLMFHQTEHKSAATGNEIAGGIIGVLAALAIGVGFFIYYKQMMKNSKPLSKMNVDLGDEDDTL